MYRAYAYNIYDDRQANPPYIRVAIASTTWYQIYQLICNHNS